MAEVRKKIRGTITVEFEMSSEKLDKNEMGEYMKKQMKNHLSEEWQTSRCKPKMSTFKFKQVFGER
jgi:hypothetical protein